MVNSVEMERACGRHLGWPGGAAALLRRKGWPQMTHHGGPKAGLWSDKPLRHTLLAPRSSVSLHVYLCLSVKWATTAFSKGQTQRPPSIQFSFLFPIICPVILLWRPILLRVQRHRRQFLSMKENRKSSQIEACIYKTQHDFLI